MIESFPGIRKRARGLKNIGDSALSSCGKFIGLIDFDMWQTFETDANFWDWLLYEKRKTYKIEI